MSEAPSSQQITLQELLDRLAAGGVLVGWTERAGYLLRDPRGAVTDELWAALGRHREGMLALLAMKSYTAAASDLAEMCYRWEHPSPEVEEAFLRHIRQTEDGARLPREAAADVDEWEVYHDLYHDSDWPA